MLTAAAGRPKLPAPELLASRRLTAAKRSAAAMNPSQNLYLIGPMGAGKSCIGRRLAEHFALPFVDLDHELEQRTGVSINLVFELEGEAGFRLRESQLLEEQSQRQGLVLATGGGAVLSAHNRELLTQTGFVLYLPAPVELQLQRLARDTRRPLLADPDRRQRLIVMAGLRNPLYESIADLTLQPEHGSVHRASERAIHALCTHWQRTFADA